MLKPLIDNHYRYVHECTAIAMALLLTPHGLAAPPKAVAHADAQVLAQHSTLTRDWSRTRAYDLEHPVTIPVVVVGLDRPSGRGYVTLFYRHALGDEARGRSSSEQIVQRAILQTASEINRLNVPLRDLVPGARATLTGWPRTSDNFRIHSLLVDSIILQSTGSRLGFHGDNRRLRDRRAQDGGALTQLE
ncbi:MAG: hypothetical protein AAGA91_14155 [Pseudomonadota bacterium]